MSLYAVDVSVEFEATRTTARGDAPEVPGWQPYWVGERGDVVRCIYETEVEVEADDGLEARAKAPEAAPPVKADGWDIAVSHRWSDCQAYERDTAGPTP